MANLHEDTWTTDNTPRQPVPPTMTLREYYALELAKVMFLKTINGIDSIAAYTVTDKAVEAANRIIKVLKATETIND